MNDVVIAACDGASKGNPGPAAWAWVVADSGGKPVRWEAGPLGTATNNVAELTALHQLLEATPADAALEVRMDSQYAMKAVTVWLPGWKRNGWKTSSGRPVANQELVVSIDRQLQDREVRFVYVPAHQEDGDPLNAIADHAASQAALAQQPAGTAHGASAVPVAAPAAQSPGRGGARRTRAATGQARRGTRTVKAKFAGTCPCGQPYPAGEQIAKSSRGWGHVACATA
ncbi:ribonuclease HI (plasmid) [Streptomyces alboflavus]|uniref:Ribonuclease H n=1 Tax=Streptomyces alboflavus TaxID=67267 RepID=A0A291W4Q6_9ACTN|nr:ribonuclease H [Streptomyces alboflavus]ATM24532.1 ribonuclease HI [Streptomyces alboflavus]